MPTRRPRKPRLPRNYECMNCRKNIGFPIPDEHGEIVLFSMCEDCHTKFAIWADTHCSFCKKKVPGSGEKKLIRETICEGCYGIYLDESAYADDPDRAYLDLIPPALPDNETPPITNMKAALAAMKKIPKSASITCQRCGAELSKEHISLYEVAVCMECMKAAGVVETPVESGPEQA